MPEQTLVVVWAPTAEEQWRARLMIESLRTFGGRLATCPVWLLVPEDRFLRAACPDMPGVRCQPLRLGDELHGYFLVDKVNACALAEELSDPAVRSLVWLSPHTLVLQEPQLLDLGPEVDAALPPVHIRNVGSLADEPLDGYWREIYAAAGVEEAPFTLESTVDAQKLRPYFNTHVFSFDPAMRLMREWRQLFHALVTDRAFQTRCCQDDLHRIFLHQAVLSALLMRRLPGQRLRLLPKEYSYPLHLHSRVPHSRRPESLNSVVCAVYEETLRYPQTLNGLGVHEPTKSWLMRYAESQPDF